MIIQFRIVERDLATLIGLNDYETLRLIEVLRRSRTLLLYQGQLNPLTAGELCQHHSPWRPFWPDDYPHVFGESIGKFDGELHLYTSNNVIPHKRALGEIPLCVLKNNFAAEVKDLQQQGTPEKVTEPTEWVSAPTVLLRMELDSVYAVDHWTSHSSDMSIQTQLLIICLQKLAMLTKVFSLAFIKTACTIRCRKSFADNLLGGWMPLASV